jgi:hypothetical protein
MSVAASRIRVSRPPTVRLLDVGLVDTVSERSHAYRMLQPPTLVNQFAAMPSFHAGTSIVAGSLVVAARVTRTAPRLRLCTANGEKDRALSRWGRHPQWSSLDTSAVIHKGDPDVVELHAIRDHQADVSAAAQRPPDNVGAEAARDRWCAVLPHAG